MVFNTTVRDSSGRLNATQQVKAAVRGEGESKNIADGIAKKIAKSYSNTVQQYEKTEVAGGAKHLTTS